MIELAYTCYMGLEPRSCGCKSDVLTIQPLRSNGLTLGGLDLAPSDCLPYSSIY